MRFEKGHKFAKGGARIGAGRKKALKTQIKDFLAEDRQNIGEYLKTIREIGLDATNPATVRLNALQYLSDRHLGRPHQSLDARVKGEVLFTADDYALIYQARAEEAKQIEATPLLIETKLT